MDEMTRGKVQLQRITDDKSRQAMFARRKQGLIKKAMELSVLCDCDVGVIIFGPGSSGPGSGGQRLYQYSSTNMDELLERYATAVCEPHERRRNGELLRHYYELSPDEDEEEPDGQDLGRGADVSGPSATAAAAAMAAVDSVVLGGGRRQQDGCLAKRMRTQSPGLGGLVPRLVPGGPPGAMAGVPAGLSTAAAALASGHIGSMGGCLPTGAGGPPYGLGVQGGPLLPAATTPLRRVAVMGGGGLGPALPLEGIKAAGFLDKRRHPVSPRSERAYEEVTAAFDRLTELRSQRAGGPGGQNPTTVLQPLSSSSGGGVGTFSLAAQQQQLQQLLQRQQQQQQQLQQQQQQRAGGTGLGGGAKRFKPLSILVPEIQTNPIIPTSNHLTPVSAANATAAAAPLSSVPGAAGAGAGAGAGGGGAATPPAHPSQPAPPGDAGGPGAAVGAVGNGLNLSASSSQPPQQQPHHHTSSSFSIVFSPQQQQPQAQQPSQNPQQQQHGQSQLSGQQQQQQQGALPPRPPTGRNPPRAQGSSGALGLNPSVGLPRPGSGAAISPVSGAAPLQGTGPSLGGLDAAASGGSFAFDRRSLGPEDGLGPLLGGSSSSRTSLDGSAANLLSMPSPPPAGGAASLFGSLDGGPLSMRSSGSQGMLAALGLERGSSLGLGGMLESPGGPMGHVDAGLRGLAPLDLLDWSSASPRSSAGNGGGGGGGGFPDEADGDGEGGTILDEDLVVRGTALSKLAPDALEAAIGSSPDSNLSGGGGGGGGSTPRSARVGGRSGPHGGALASANNTSTVFANAAAAAASIQGLSGAGAGGAAGGQEQAARQAGDGGDGGDAAEARSGQQSPRDGARGGAQHHDQQRQRQSSLAMFSGEANGLVTELSFATFTPGAAAAALEAAQRQHQGRQQQGRERAQPPASEAVCAQETAAPDLVVVGRALEAPAGLQTASTGAGTEVEGAGGAGLDADADPAAASHGAASGSSPGPV